MRVIKFRGRIPKDSIGYQIMLEFCRNGCFYQDDQYLESFVRRANQFNYGGSGHSSYGAAEFSQFTGLQDKHGVDIYEGDIVRRKRFLASEDFIGVVEYSDKVAAFVIEPNITLIEDLLSRATDIEVLGNIYESPHLLNKEA